MTTQFGSSGKKLTANNICDRYGIVRRTLGRWMVDGQMGFPKSIEINGRHYWEEAEIAEFDRRTLMAALAKREAA